MRTKKNPKEIRLEIRLDQRSKEHLERMAQHNKLSRAAVIRELIKGAAAQAAQKEQPV